jgi:flagellar assembly protein FliH
LSKAYLGKNVPGQVTSYRDLLPSLGEAQKGPARAARLGRTANAIETARAEARAEGYAQGRAEGLGEGREAGRAEGFQAAYDEEMETRRKLLDDFAAELNQVTESVLSAVYQWFAGSEDSLAALAMLIATRIVARELTTTSDVALSIAREALAEVTHAESARIRVNPFSSPVLVENKDALMAVSPSLKGIQISDDASMVGGCVIESAGGVIDATVETRIAGILGEIREHYAAKAEPGAASAPRARKSRAKSETTQKEAA